MSHGLFYRCPCYVSGPGNISVVLLSMKDQKALGFHQKYLNLCSKDEWSTYRFEMTWWWVINDIIFIFGWTIPLTAFFFQSVVKLMQGLLQCMMRQVRHLTLWSCSFVILIPSVELYSFYFFYLFISSFIVEVMSADIWTHTSLAWLSMCIYYCRWQRWRSSNTHRAQRTASMPNITHLPVPQWLEMISGGTCRLMPHHCTCSHWRRWPPQVRQTIYRVDSSTKG